MTLMMKVAVIAVTVMDGGGGWDVGDGSKSGGVGGVA